MTWRVVISLAASKDKHLFKIYVNNIFLQGDLYEDVYMALTQGFYRQGEYQVCKSLYGLIQASRQWNIKLTNSLTKGGYFQSVYDHSLFTKNVGADIVIILIC